MVQRYIPLLPVEDLKSAIRKIQESFANMSTFEERIQRFSEVMDKYMPNANFMPDWSPDEATHYMMYETCSEGTPISPAFATPEELARWLTDTGASISGSMRASYEQWLSIARGSEVCVGAMIDTATGQTSPAIVGA